MHDVRVKPKITGSLDQRWNNKLFLPDNANLTIKGSNILEYRISS